MVFLHNLGLMIVICCRFWNSGLSFFEMHERIYTFLVAQDWHALFILGLRTVIFPHFCCSGLSLFAHLGAQDSVFADFVAQECHACGHSSGFVGV